MGLNLSEISLLYISDYYLTDTENIALDHLLPPANGG